jgi:hypothetical protein
MSAPGGQPGDVYQWTVNGNALSPNTTGTVPLTWADLEGLGVNDAGSGSGPGGSYPIALAITSGPDAGHPIAPVNLSVTNTPPTLSISGAGTANEGTVYTLNLSGTEVSADTIDHWTITWSPGDVQTVTGNPSSVTHTYYGAQTYTITATATDDDGTYSANNQTVTVVTNHPVVVASFFESAVYVIDTGTGALLDTLVAPNAGTGTLSNPAGVTDGPDGNLYFSSQNFTGVGNNSIVKYDTATRTLSTFIDLNSTQAQNLAADVGAPAFVPGGLAFGPDGDLYVALNGGTSSTKGAVVRFGITGGLGGITYDGTASVIASTGIVQPTEMAFGTSPSDQGTLYVSNSGMGDVVQIADAVGATAVGPTSNVFIPAGTGGMQYPTSLVWGPDGKLYVVDLGATSPFQGQVLQFEADGTFDKVFTTPGSLQYQFPSDAVFDSSGNLLTADLGLTYPTSFGGPGTSGMISKFDSSGNVVNLDLTATSFPGTPTPWMGSTIYVTNFSPSQFTMNIGNQAPSVSAGSSYSIAAGSSLTLNATATDPDGDPLTFSWDVNGDGRYGDTTGANPTLTWAQLNALGITGPATLTIHVRVADGHDHVVTSAAVTLTVHHVDTPGVFRNGTWFLDPTQASYSPLTVTPVQFGTTGDTPVTGDWLGDGIKRIGVFRNGTWFLSTTNTDYSSSNTIQISFGAKGDIPVVGHWLGGATDYVGVFRPSTGQWFLSLNNQTYSGVAGTFQSFSWGANGDQAVAGDWNGDGVTDVGVFRAKTGTWYLDQGNVSWNGSPIIAPFQFGAAGDTAVVGNWLGGATDYVGVFRQSTGQWFLSKTNTNYSSANAFTLAFGTSGDIPLIGQWRGDGVDYVAVFRAKTGQWYLDMAQASYDSATALALAFGANGDKPIVSP